METVTLSADLTIALPRQAFDQLGLRAGRTLEVVIREDRLELIPLPEIASLRGFLSGMDTTIAREKDRP